MGDPVLHQRYKDIYFLVLSKATLPNFLYRRNLRPWHSKQGQRLDLHLGCGPKYLTGFVNIDANPFHKLDLWLDVRNGLPFRSSSVDSIYSTHMFEHFYPDELVCILRECFRVVKSGAGVRIVVPNLRNAIMAYEQGRIDWFGDAFPRHYKSIGGRLTNFIFCDGQHRSAFDFSHLEEVLRNAGFSRVVEVAEGKSVVYGDDVPKYERSKDEFSHSLYVEGLK
jgi:predicted SAM-dependent methyltransferase